MSEYSPLKGKTGLKRILNATSYSMAGFKAAFQHEAAFRQIIYINLMLIPITFFLDVSRSEQAILIAVCLLAPTPEPAHITFVPSTSVALG